jgi:hypothetical protein
VLSSKYTSIFGDFVCFFVPSSGRGFLSFFPMDFPKCILLGILEPCLILHLTYGSLQAEINH